MYIIRVFEYNINIFLIKHGESLLKREISIFILLGNKPVSFVILIIILDIGLFSVYIIHEI